jgi:hypothetical protein
MEFIKLRLDPETRKRLIASAAQELRPIHWQAEVILMRALGTWGNLPAAPDPQLYDHLATAAPELLAALEVALARLYEIEETEELDRNTSSETYQRIEAAIAKAKGS